ncbi:CDP-alcohol phosphatidyltransferase family protein [Haloechinothrix sp. YIM 98757]|uniref:CDP-alcohol phosphatidyltransferase family protein n=2 Tax=Haloechinothrix aidingensis TaxID=2752311 RepID=A0A838A9D8_9PSEU|nr:CDP-alcohol phosphatidyltransferase family protein [Haloechinothrix aidingensis]
MERMEGYDEDRVLLDSAVKGSDGFFTTFFVSPYSKYIARWAARRGWTPNGVTVLSMALGIVAAVLFATGTREGLIAGAVMLQASFTLDCVDGQLARYTRTFSKLGSWLDSVFDRAKEYVAYAGLAIGAAIGFGLDVWPLAAAAFALQTVRHAVDFSFASARHHVLSTLPALPLDQPEDRLLPGRRTEGALPEEDALPAARTSLLNRLGRSGAAVSRALERRSVTRWPKKIIVLPIGERMALISVTAAVWNPQVTFIALLVWGSLALLYQLTGRTLRTVAA